MAKWFEKLANYLERKEQEKQNGKYVKVILDRDTDEPYLIRYYLLNLRPFARINLHKVLRSDIDGLHDHPWPWATWILSGGYWESTPKGRFWRKPGTFRIRTPKALHRLEIDPSVTEPVWTLFIMGPKMKEWGFIDENEQWVKWDTYLAERRERQNEEKRTTKQYNAPRNTEQTS
jgi:hypothetical protein